VSGGQFDWGGRLLKSNGGAQRFPQNGWKSFVECKGRRELDCERIKATLGITGWSPPRVHIDGEVWHLDVGSSHPGAGIGPKGWAVRPLKRHASWVQNVVRQFGPYLSWAMEIWEELLLVREDRSGRTAGVPVSLPELQLGNYVRKG